MLILSIAPLVFVLLVLNDKVSPHQVRGHDIVRLQCV